MIDNSTHTKLGLPDWRVVLNVGDYEVIQKRLRQAQASIPELDIGQYNLRPRVIKAAESKPSRGQMQDQGGPLRCRGSRFQESRPYNKDQRYKQQSTRESRQEQELELRSR
ncbi:hypothetical protein TNCV_4080201 [Trichonephila clavipes]|nr:hypothetical protein TNCV_4080201 [Trichonephila clavipes]